MIPALANIGTVRFFTNRREVMLGNYLFDSAITLATTDRDA